ncbi:MAG TPA: hypothetical protein VFN53_09260 [Acidobacteriaceae bacterium]|nr:hypothetical protein [Acidobacteriaceae bacterium]
MSSAWPKVCAAVAMTSAGWGLGAPSLKSFRVFHPDRSPFAVADAAQRKDRGPGVINHGCSMIGEFTEAAHQPAMGKDLVGVVHVPRASQRQLFSWPRSHLHPNTIPGPAPVVGMALGRPARHVAGKSGDGIEAARLRRQVHRLPLRVVEVGIGPARIVAGVELPRPSERHDGLAERDLAYGRGCILRRCVEREER